MDDQGDQVREMLRKSLEGEILVQAFFEGLAKALPANRKEWELLARLEEVTGRLIEPVAKAHGVELDASEAVRTTSAFGERATGETRDELLKGAIGLANDEFLPLYRQLSDLPGIEESELGRNLVTHELALVHCCEALLAGETGGEAKVEEFLALHPIS